MFGLNTKHKKVSFHYIPRFYDEKKEEFRNRVRAIKESMGEDGAGGKPKPGSSIRGAFTSKKTVRSERQIRLRNQNIRLLVILLILGYLTWQMLQSDFIKDLFDKFEPNTTRNYE